MTITILGKKKKFIFILFHTKPLLGLNRVECVFVQLEKQVNYFSVTLLLSQVFQKVSPQKEYLKRTRNAARWRTILKKQKNSFFFDKTDSPHFIENYARMMVSVLAYNLFNFLKTCCFDKKWRGLQVNTIRFRLFKVAGKLVRTARQMYLKLSSSHVYQEEFYNIFRRIRRIRQYI